MCGRYVVKNPVTKTSKLVKSAIQVEDNENYNAHPYQKLPVIKKYKNGNTLEALKWGLIPGWAKDNIIEIHHRQPVILNQTDINRYSNLELQGSAFLKERSKPNLIFHEVSKDVNKPTNNTASLIQKVTD